MKFKRHDSQECNLVKRVADKRCPERWLTVLRVLRIRKQHPESWQKFLQLEHHLEDRRNCPLMEINKTDVWDILRHYLPELTDGLQIEDILKICGILDSNSFRIDKHGTRGLFLATSMLNHNCLPNARVIFTNNGSVSVLAKKGIARNQPITITYCAQLTNTESRLEKLKKSKFFICQCDLCHDVTEKGTYMSALTCPKCKGHLLPQSFHSTDPSWNCDQCSFSTSHEKAKKLSEAIRNSYVKISSDPRVMTIEKVSQLESIYVKRAGTVLPPTHQIMLDLKQDLSNLYDTNPNLDVTKRLEFTKERLNLVEQLEGKDTDSRLKGFLRFRLHNLLVVKVAQLQKKKKLTEEIVKELGAELGFNLTESARILKFDHGCPPALIDSVAALLKNKE